MPDVGPNDLDEANGVYNARLAAAGVPDDGFAEVPGGFVHGGLFESHDALSMAEALAVSYRVDEEGLEHYEEEALGIVAQMAVHGMAIGVLAERARWERRAREARDATS